MTMTKKLPGALQTPLPVSPALDLEKKTNSGTTSEKPSKAQSISFPKAKLRLECRNLDHAGSDAFFENSNPANALSIAVSIVLSTLYIPKSENDHVPPTRSVTLILRSMDGVAYTTGLDIDEDHKEIHFSLEYIKGISTSTPGREAHEIQGVLVHEMVHAWQWNAFGSAPGGLIEGIADFVRLKAGLDPPHWGREPGGSWDAGYQHTGFFLEWIEEEFGTGSVRKINAALQHKKYDEDLWKSLFGKSVDTLWQAYQQTFPQDPKKEPKHDGDDEGDEGASTTEAVREHKPNAVDL